MTHENSRHVVSDADEENEDGMGPIEGLHGDVAVDVNIVMGDEDEDDDPDDDDSEDDDGADQSKR